MLTIEMDTDRVEYLTLVSVPPRRGWQLQEAQVLLHVSRRMER